MLRAVGLFAALLGLSLAATAAAEEKKSDEAKLIGKWKLVKTSKGELPPGLNATIEVKKGGKFAMRVELNGKTQDGNGTWKLDGKKLTVEYTDGPEKGKKETMTVKKLTDEDFATEDDKGVTEEFKRVKAEKPEK